MAPEGLSMSIEGLAASTFFVNRLAALPQPAERILRKLLANRFHFGLHRTTRDMQGYTISVSEHAWGGKKGNYDLDFSIRHFEIMPAGK